MAKLIRVVNGSPVEYSLKELRADNKTVSFPADFPSEVLEKYNVFRVESQPRPDPQNNNEMVIEDSPQRIGNSWRQQWTTRAKNGVERAKDKRKTDATKNLEALARSAGLTPAEFRDAIRLG